MGCEYRQRLVSAGGSEGPWLTGGGDVGVGHRVSVGLGVMAVQGRAWEMMGCERE